MDYHWVKLLTYSIGNSRIYFRIIFPKEILILTRLFGGKKIGEEGKEVSLIWAGLHSLELRISHYWTIGGQYSKGKLLFHYYRYIPQNIEGGLRIFKKKIIITHMIVENILYFNPDLPIIQSSLIFLKF